jgi:transketolase
MLMKSSEKGEGMEKVDKEKIAFLKGKAKTIRRNVVEILSQTSGGHFGGALSAADILAALYFEIMKINPQDPCWPDRDRFILSKGHVSVAKCAALAEAGYFPYQELLTTYNKLGSPFGMHEDMTKIKGCDMTAGSLGHGLSAGVGMAIAGKHDHKDYRVFVMIGDADLQEGSTWEAIMSASHFKLDNLVCIVDRNQIGVDGFTEELMALEPLGQKLKDFRWQVREIDGHNMEEVVAALKSLPLAPGCPSAIIANTIKGKGVSFMEGNHHWHFGVATKEQAEAALAELEKEI